ncbi:MAG: hypothetical protein AAGJ18_21860 [Bacteroidota bacterium]
MTKRFIYLIIVTLSSIVTLLSSCAKERSENFQAEDLFIAEELAPYFDRFVAEGQARGLTVDLVAKNIEGYLIDIEESDVIGQCTYGNNTTRRVNIDRAYWNRATDLEKEFVIFHELGHCYLNRSHLNSQENRQCTSIMHSGTGTCRFRYTTSSRSGYLDELFDEPE